jgi:hypothetical protein
VNIWMVLAAAGVVVIPVVRAFLDHVGREYRYLIERELDRDRDFGPRRN